MPQVYYWGAWFLAGVAAALAVKLITAGHWPAAVITIVACLLPALVLMAYHLITLWREAPDGPR